MSENITTIEQKLDNAVEHARVPEGKNPLEFHTEAAKVATGAASILDKAAEFVAAGDRQAAGDRAAESLGFSLESTEYIVAADSVFTEGMLAVLKGKNMKDHAVEAEQYRETASHLRDIAAAEQRYVDKLSAASTSAAEGSN